MSNIIQKLQQQHAQEFETFKELQKGRSAYATAVVNYSAYLKARSRKGWGLLRSLVPVASFRAAHRAEA